VALLAGALEGPAGLAAGVRAAQPPVRLAFTLAAQLRVDADALLGLVDAIVAETALAIVFAAGLAAGVRTALPPLVLALAGAVAAADVAESFVEAAD
jgi:hypothetical protein